MAILAALREKGMKADFISLIEHMLKFNEEERYSFTELETAVTALLAGVDHDKSDFLPSLEDLQQEAPGTAQGFNVSEAFNISAFRQKREVMIKKGSGLDS